MEKLWKSNSEGEIQYRLLYFFIVFLTLWKCHVVCFIFDSEAVWQIEQALFFPSVVVRRRLRACVILYQEPFIAANAVFVMLYWSLKGEFIFQSGPAHTAEEKGALSSKMPQQYNKS